MPDELLILRPLSAVVKSSLRTSITVESLQSRSMRATDRVSQVPLEARRIGEMRELVMGRTKQAREV